MFAKRTAAALILGTVIFAAPPAFAEDAAPAAPAAPAAMSPAADAATDQILNAMGIKRTLELIIPGMMTEFEQNVATTRPDLREPLRQTLQGIKPEFDKQAMGVYIQAKALLASLMSEKELVDVAAFFTSPTGQKLLATQPLFFQKFNELMVGWRQQVSSDIVTQARAEMKKNGHDF
jgi:uncharacterized protein